MSPAPIPPINRNPESEPGNEPGNAPGDDSGHDGGHPPAAPGGPSHADRPGPATVSAPVDVHAARLTMASALAQGWALAREVDRLSGLLADERMRYANLWAAVRAAVHADDDGETDALTYLRTECPDLFTDPPTGPGAGGPTAAPGRGPDRGCR